MNGKQYIDRTRRNFSAQMSLSDAISAESLAFVALYKALGGGWQ